MRNSRTSEGRRGFYGGRGRTNDDNDSELNVAVQGIHTRR
jgi:hypothetical protein